MVIYPLTIDKSEDMSAPVSKFNTEQVSADSICKLAEALSPIIAIRVAVSFSHESLPGLFHQPALTAMLRTLMDGQLADEPLLWVQATETGRAHYNKGEDYRFNIYAARPAHALLMRVIERLPAMHRHLRSEQRVPFGANLRFHGLFHPLSDAALRPTLPVTLFDLPQLLAEQQRFANEDSLRVRLLSPLRVLRDKAERGNARGEARYVHDGDQLAALLFRRLHDSLLAIAKPLQVWMPRQQHEPQADAYDLFHVDWNYRDAGRQEKTMAGMLGWLQFAREQISDAQLLALLLAQRLGMGQRRSFGWGALRVETLQGEGVVAPIQAASNMLQRTAAHDNLRAALRASTASADTPERWRKLPRQHLPATAVEWLQQVHTQLLATDYEPPPLIGRVLMPPNARLRPLAMPPWHDRCVQRAVARVLTDELETIFSPTSFGYRRGRSRQQLRDQLGALYRQGYRHYFETDISGFFDHVSHARIDTRLHGLLGDDPVITLILRWLAAPVQYRDTLLPRARGLPQGSPLSPVLANMLLEDLDADCQAHQLKLLRYADDFIVLCRDEAQAQAAWQRAENSVDELGLCLKSAKTGVGRLDADGSLRFLGYHFIGDMAIECTRKQAAAESRVVIPPQSWLAEIVAQHPELRTQLQTEWAQRHGRTPAARQPITAASRSQLAGEQNKAWNTETADTPQTTQQQDTDHPISAKNTARRSLLAGEHNIADYSETAHTHTTSHQQSNNANASMIECQFGEGSLLCITEPALLAQKQGQLHVLTDQEGGRSYPWNELEAVLIFGLARITSGAVAAALDHGVNLHFLGGNEGYRGRLTTDHYQLDELDLALRQRHCFSEQAIALQLAQQLVVARLGNQKEVLRQRTRRDPAGQAAISSIEQLMRKAAAADSIASLYGYEGNAARLYFATLATTLPDWVAFTSRNRRPPRDPFNALLSLGFTIMYARSIGLIQAMGLHPRIGFYHRPHGRHAVLASDLMEPFRHLVERTACTVINRGELKAQDFTTTEQQGCRLSRNALKRYLQRLAESMTRPMSTLDGGNGNFYLLMQQQIRSLDRLRRGEQAAQPWFFRTR